MTLLGSQKTSLDVMLLETEGVNAPNQRIYKASVVLDPVSWESPVTTGVMQVDGFCFQGYTR